MDKQSNAALRELGLNRYPGDDKKVKHLEHGRKQPQAVRIEEAVLGAIMIDKDALPIVIDILKPESFYMESHKIIYKVMNDLFINTQPVDLLTVSDAVRKTGKLKEVGGYMYLTDLTNRVASSANIEYHARIIAQKHIQRELIRVSTDIIRDAYDETIDVFDLLDGAEKGLFGIAENNLSRSYADMGALTRMALEKLEKMRDQEDGLTGVPTGFTDLDRMTNGWQDSDLIILAARPGMGKTSLVLALARNAAMDFDKGIALFSLEMSGVQLVQRLISMESEVSGEKMRSGKMEDYEWQQMHTAVERLSDAPIYIDDTPGINIFELRAKCRRLHMQHGISMVIIDYLQLMSGGGNNKNGNREQEVSQISRSLKGLAKELSVPVIALSQLSRAVETRGGTKRPQLSDLRESGSIEQDADMVGFIYRPEYYDILEDEEGQSLKGVGEVIIAKNRHGATDTIKLRWQAEFAKFGNLDDLGALPPGSISSGDFNDGAITLPSRINDQDLPPMDDIPF